MKTKIFDLFYILLLAGSYILVYDLAKVRSDNENKMTMEVQSIQMDMMIKERLKKRGK